MAELVDALDSKSGSLYGSKGSSPFSPTRGRKRKHLARVHFLWYNRNSWFNMMKGGQLK